MPKQQLSLSDLLAQTREGSSLFDHLVSPWTPVVMMSELAAEGGALAESIISSNSIGYHAQTQHPLTWKTTWPMCCSCCCVWPITSISIRTRPIPGCSPQRAIAWNSS